MQQVNQEIQDVRERGFWQTILTIHSRTRSTIAIVRQVITSSRIRTWLGRKIKFLLIPPVSYLSPPGKLSPIRKRKFQPFHSDASLLMPTVWNFSVSFVWTFQCNSRCIERCNMFCWMLRVLLRDKMEISVPYFTRREKTSIAPFIERSSFDSILFTYRFAMKFRLTAKNYLPSNKYDFVFFLTNT